MLEFSLPGGGLWGVGLTGFLCGLKERRLVPDVVCSVSSGSHAAYLTYSNSDANRALACFQSARDLVSKPLKRFLPPFDMQGETIRKLCEPFIVTHDSFMKNGLRHFFVGYVSLKSRRFVTEDILAGPSDQAYRTIIKSSTIPFLTNFVPHFDGCIDGGFVTNNFTSPLPTSEKWMISYDFGRLGPLNRDIFQRRIVLPRPKGSPLFMTDAQMQETFERCFEIGVTLRRA
ncbi:MAG TPA: patatin-like phospholipase family protein [Oligoflexus sp.]|uniref:patatin-like phospholipase family protein n=1 Tax=Oligoflexus sp. TaxID=1971216 RepID=UPI002D3CF01E|nr:patatin-like phospholipase family protein [Oligoflexus sp.]HYX33778.1 patatin-like phospholipase family protein [Oligoflexus sp.]